MTSKFALIIANTEYQDASFAKLTAPGKDAEEFAHILRDTELAAFDDVQILVNEGEGRIRRFIARFFAERKRDDLLLLYFSGHGVRNEQGQLFLAANDTEISILEATGIPAEFVTYAMNNSHSQRQVLILDCCNSGAFAYGSKAASPVGKSMGIATAFEGSGFGRVVLTATDATQYAWEGDKVIGNTQKSVFTHFLIEGLRGNADRNGDGRIDVDELYEYAYEEVVRQTPKQTPQKWSYRQQGDIVLRENLKPRQVKPAPLPSDLLEMLSYPHASIRKAGVQELIPLLDGKHLGLARAAEEKLREMAASDASLDLRKIVNDALNVRGFLVEVLAPSSEALKETSPVEKTAALKMDEMGSTQPVKPYAPAEVPKEERKDKKEPGKASASPSHKSSSPLEAFPKMAIPAHQALEQKKNASKFNARLIGWVGIFVVGAFSVWAAGPLINNMLVGPPKSTNSPLPTKTVTIAPTAREHYAPPATSNPNSPPKSSLNIGSTMTGKDGMTLMYVHAGEFTMGSDDGEADEKPVHTIYLDAFWIDQTEVANDLFSSFVSATGYKTDAEKEADLIYMGGNNYTYSTGADWQHPVGLGSNISNNEKHPVIHVSWNDAIAYCKWAGRRLPTEAEWEKAARGTDGREYPWGNESPNVGLLNYNSNVGGTTEVGIYPDGKSIFGVYDMAGNVWEWVNDWYQSDYYATLEDGVSNPQGPSMGKTRVLRGGSWFYNRSDVRSSNRRNYAPGGFFYYGYGFRCAMNAIP
jgi:formylglycine-generating enzyme required for sulfatase activity